MTLQGEAKIMIFKQKVNGLTNVRKQIWKSILCYDTKVSFLKCCCAPVNLLNQMIFFSMRSTWLFLRVSFLFWGCVKNNRRRQQFRVGFEKKSQRWIFVFGVKEQKQRKRKSGAFFLGKIFLSMTWGIKYSPFDFLLVQTGPQKCFVTGEFSENAFLTRLHFHFF